MNQQQPQFRFEEIIKELREIEEYFEQKIWEVTRRENGRQQLSVSSDF